MDLIVISILVEISMIFKVRVMVWSLGFIFIVSGIFREVMVEIFNKDLECRFGVSRFFGIFLI